MIRVYILLLLSLFISGCFTEEQKQSIKENTIVLGNKKLNYYSNKSITSLEIPPDLTSPNYENSFRVSEFSSDVDSKTVNLTNNELNINSKEKIEKAFVDIEVKKFGNRRWLIVNKSPEIVWELSKQFLKEKGFVIKKSNKKIGVMETDYLENKPEIPAQSLGFFRSFLASTVSNVSYTLPSVDSYKIRIEPLNDNTKSEVYLSLSSMAEVSTGDDRTMWQSKEKDNALETEMLYSLMLFLGSDSTDAREKIVSAKEEGRISVNLSEGLNGYAKLAFKLNLIETWDNLAWALSEANIEVVDKDLKEKTFYIRYVDNQSIGFMSKIFGTEAIIQQYQIQLKTLDRENTEVYFNDISEQNKPETKKLSHSLFKKIHSLF